MKDTVYGVRSHKHIGDSIITTGAVRNVKLARPDLRFKYVGWAPEIWENNPDVEGRDVAVDVELPVVDYGRVAMEQRASRGNVVEAFTHSLCGLLGIPMVPMATRVPNVALTDEEKADGEKWRRCVLLNANGQTVSFSKCYPHWQDVVNALSRDFHVVQVGSREKRNISPVLSDVLDWRGRSENVREYMSMVHGCAGVISPPSGIVHLAAAFGKPAVVVCGARELPRLTDYPDMEHVSLFYGSCGSGADWACVSLTKNGKRPCRDVVEIGGRHYAGCMASVAPEWIVEAARRVFGKESGR